MNNSESIPYSFRIYAAIYDFDIILSDKMIHKIIDRLNSNLCSGEEYQGKIRKRKFFATKPEEADEILEAISTINGFQNRLHKLHKWNPDKQEIEDEIAANAIMDKKKSRVKPLRFLYGRYLGRIQDLFPSS